MYFLIRFPLSIPYHVLYVKRCTFNEMYSMDISGTLVYIIFIDVNMLPVTTGIGESDHATMGRP